MDLAQLIRGRRSIQMFEDRPVPVDDLKTMLETAVWVPNHKMTQPWRFIFVHGESRKTLAEIFQKEKGSKGNDSAERKANSEKNYQQIMNVPLFLMVVMDENPVPKLREEDYAATSCVIQNFSLLAWEQGIGMIWKTNQMINKQEFRDAFSIERGEKVVGILYIGYPAKVPKARPRQEIAPLIRDMN